MSRTDKDRPYRVRSADHYESGRSVWHDHRRGDCDLTDFHDRTPTGRSNNCSRELEYWVFSPWGGSAPRWYRESVWHNPERVRERVELGNARRRYNAGDELKDFDFFNRQARSSANWSWE